MGAGARGAVGGAAHAGQPVLPPRPAGRALHSSNFHLNLSRFSQYTLYTPPNSPKHRLNIPYKMHRQKPPDTPYHPLNTPFTTLNATPIPHNVLTLSRKVEECCATRCRCA